MSALISIFRRFRSYLPPILVLAATSGCTRMVEKTNVVRYEVDKGDSILNLVGNPKGFTGYLCIQLSQEITPYKITQDELREEELTTRQSSIKGAAYITMSIVYCGLVQVFEIIGGDRPFKTITQWQETGRVVPVGASQRVWGPTEYEPLPSQKIYVSIPKASLSGFLETDENGQIHLHLLEAVVETRGESDITVDLVVQDGPRLRVCIAQNEAIRMLHTYRTALLHQAQILVKEIDELQARNDELQDQRLALRFANLSLQDEIRELRSENRRLLVRRNELTGRNESLRQEVAIIESQEFTRSYLPIRRETAQYAKNVYDAASSGRFIYRNSRLIKRGVSISRAFRLTLPTFLAGLVLEELVWSVVEPHLAP